MTVTEHVSILFTDLVSSTELAAAVDRTEADELRRNHFTALRRAVGVAGGSEVKNLGDGLMVVFPTASSAMGCAVAMQQEVDAENRRRGQRLGLRVGISSGEVSHEEGDYFGEPAIEAARLCARAEGGQVLVSDVVRATAGRHSPYDLRPMGELALKGLPDPVMTYEVAWVPAAPTAPAVAPLADELTAGPFAFAGRSAQLEHLAMAWKLAGSGGTPLVLLSGEPGIGKTRLAGALACRVHGDSGTVLFGRCDEELAVPYQPFIEPLRQLLSRSPAALSAHTARHGPLLAHLSPTLADLVGPPPDSQADPETERLRCFDAACDLITSAAADWPVLLVLDDLHWASAPTLALLRHLVGRIGDHPVLILGTYRDMELDRTHPLSGVLADWRRQDVGERIALAGLDTDEVVAMVATAAGHDLDDKAVALARAVHDETEGNPFFIGEVLRDLAESGAITRQGDRWTPGAAMDGFVLPQGVREVVGRRLGRLPERTQQVLALAAVVGPSFEATVIEAVHSPPEEVLDCLEGGVTAGLLREEASRIGWFSFTHALVRQTLLSELTMTRRTRLHREIANAIERLHERDLDSVVPELAHHLSAAAPLGEAARAVSYAGKAYEQAFDRFAVEEAIFWLDRALELSELDVDFAGREKADLLIKLAQLHVRRTDRVRGLEVAMRAVDVARDADDMDLLAEAAEVAQNSIPWGVTDPRVEAVVAEVLERCPGATRARVRLLFAQSYSTFFYSNGRSGMALVEQATELAQQLGDPTLTLMAGAYRPFALFATPALEEAVALAVQIIEMTEGLRGVANRELTALHSGMIWLHGLIQARRGNLPGLVERRTELLRVSTETDTPIMRAAATQWFAAESMLVGRLDDVEAQAAAALEHSGQDAMFLDGHAAQLTWLRLLQGRLDEASDMADKAFHSMPPELGVRCHSRLAVGAERGDVTTIAETLAGLPRGPGQLLEPDWSTTMGLYALAAAAAATGDADLGARVYEELLPYDGQMLLFCCCLVVSSAAHALGLAATAFGNTRLAIGHYRSAVAYEEASGAPVLASRSRVNLAELLSAHDPTEAQVLAARAAGDSASMGMGHTRERAERLLGRTA